MGERRVDFQIAGNWTGSKSLGWVWFFRLSMTTLALGTAIVMIHKYTEWNRVMIALIGGVLLMYAVAALPIGVSERQRKIAVLIQTILLLLITWSPVIWFVGFSGEIGPETIKRSLPGGKSGGAMLSPDGEVIERHTFRSPGHAIGAFVGIPIAMGILSWPLLALSVLFLKRLAIVWYGKDPLLIASAFFGTGGGISTLAFVFGISAYAAKRPIFPTSTLVVVLVCAVAFYSLAWLTNPNNLDQIARALGSEEE